MANSPSYYRRGTIEVWDFIRDQELPYHLGNAVKYICRAGFKDNYVEDLEKAIHYLQNELEYVTTFEPSYRVPPSVRDPQPFEWEITTEESDRRGI
jgi:hypothetical protein|tara:strand:- start:1708 stop:1995 length:288 start_codon:yes stop_codon:yes gene_type:complete